MRVGTVCYATNQGLGHLAKSFYDAGVVTDVMVYRHPHGDRPSNMQWYPEGTIELVGRSFTCEATERFLDDIDVVLFFETPFDWTFANRCHERGVKTAIIPMYEWFLEHPPHRFDLFINPSLLDQKYFPQGIHIPIPVEDHIKWSERKYAMNFLHNAGNIGSRNHKGTLELLQAMELVAKPIKLTIRCQDEAGIKRLMDQAPKSKSDDRIMLIPREIERGSLFHPDFDVYVAPEKYNGLSLPLQEAFASGMMVITTDRFPANTWLPKKPLIQVRKTRIAQTMGGHLKFEESIVRPVDIADELDHWYGQDISDFSLMGARYREENSWAMLKHHYIEALESIL